MLLTDREAGGAGVPAAALTAGNAAAALRGARAGLDALGPHRADRAEGRAGQDPPWGARAAARCRTTGERGGRVRHLS